MTTKQYLGRIEFLESRANQKLKEINGIRTQMGLASPVLGDKIQTTPDMDKIGSAIARLVEAEKSATKQLDRFLREKNKIIKQIEMLDNIDYYNVLMDRYVNYMRLTEIAECRFYSDRQIKRIHKSALNCFEELFGQEYLCK